MSIIINKFIPDQSRPGLPTTTSGVAQRGICGNYASAKHSENKSRKREGRQMKRQREVWKGRRSLIRVGTLNIGTMTIQKLTKQYNSETYQSLPICN